MRKLLVVFALITASVGTDMLGVMLGYVKKGISNSSYGTVAARVDDPTHIACRGAKPLDPCIKQYDPSGWLWGR
jgi:hypothetical protein